MEREPTHRRPLLKALAGGVVAIGAVGAAAKLGGSQDTSAGPFAGLPTLQLSSDSGSDVSALETRLGDALLPQLSPTRWRSARLPTSTHSMVAFTWRTGAADPHIHIRSRVDGLWQPWRRVPVLHDLPDDDSGEGAGVSGTELVWIGDSDGIQVQVARSRPTDLTLVLLHPAPRPDDESVTPRSEDHGHSNVSARAAVDPAVPRPALLTRRDWGADDSWRDGRPSYNDTIQQVHVHHTVNSNDYSKADVPALIRGMYRYHTSNLGWSDIGYNFLVDRFGRIWVGRAGGAARPVRGAHTLGFNATSTGVSVIGNFDLVAPTTATLNAIVRVAAWKLDKYGRKPTGHAEVRSEGSDKFRSNQVVELPVIDGHRDTNDTACPGQHLYDALPVIRRRTKARIDRFHASERSAVSITQPAAVSGTPALGEVLTVEPGAFSPPDATPAYAWMRNGSGIVGASGASYLTVPEDVGTQLSVRVDLSKQGYQTATELLTVAGPVTAPASVSLRIVGRPGRAAVHVEVTPPPGVSGPAVGQATVRMNKRTKTVDLVNGRATIRFRAITPGQHLVSVDYSGSPWLTPAVASGNVTIS
ncbi:MAG: N-acetylmuramoyl-L-alanine amidase, family 2 [Nocardioides sp.]|nr:N-acetylmuramoyl-L-alanine amidase, family 2 [Nocardioides sp.]